MFHVSTRKTPPKCRHIQLSGNRLRRTPCIRCMYDTYTLMLTVCRKHDGGAPEKSDGEVSGTRRAAED